ncbi:hypothetical protein SAMN05421812_12358 [Asanoa hainanensis]|uniref:Uncharacterized protein n=1 Tax=Asanoa hainanensis TaxID=560556 RepID=A0A239PF58_9ACTN|nr:hypothetical protein [Asanoa hainanensis]SNT65505.1 hypothetical protein SAMN05421812_12358 [Asanoa hainanensis]
MSSEQHDDVMVIPAALGGCAAVAAVGLAAAVVASTTTGRLLAVAVTVGVLSAVLTDTRAWLVVTAAGAATFLLVVDGGENGWPFLVIVGLAAVLGRGQRWMRRPAASSTTSPKVDH